jgi:hypothetical protein
LRVSSLEPVTAKRHVWRPLAIAVAVVLTVALLLGVLWIATHRQRVADQFTVWGFEPTSAIETYAERSTMTGEGQFLFYASKPMIAPEGEFDEICAAHQEDVGILGCYLRDERTIFLYDVRDDRLDGLEEVVAAHEMLHAAWDRMSKQEQTRLGRLLEAEAANKADDEEFAATLAFYATSEPGERLNELHSIIGTEFADIGAELEAHYALYFSDRRALTALHETSNAVFVEQARQTDALVAQINALVTGIDADFAAYNAGYEALNADIQSFNSRARNGGFASQEQFNAERRALMNRQANLDALYASISARETEYDTLVAQLDALNAVAAELNEAINIEPHDSAGL